MKRQTGFTLAEVMVAMTIGLIVLSGVSSAYIASNRASRDSQDASDHVENGRQAIEYIAYDLRHAGYYGRLTVLPAPGSTLPDPCETSNIAAMSQAIAFPVQAYDAPATSPLSCIGATDFVPGTDVLVVRRVASESLQPTDFPLEGAVYMQANGTQSELQIGNSANAVGLLNKADGNPATIFNRGGVTAAPIQRYLVHIYFIAPCTVPAGGGNSCTGAADDDGNPIPSLKRLQLIPVSGLTEFQIVPLVSGIENLQIDFGVDDVPTTVNAFTGMIGDGAPDCVDTDPGSATNTGVTSGCATANPGAVEQWVNVADAQVHVLARNYRAQSGFTDNKIYNLGLGLSAASPGGSFKRHAYSTMVRFTNVSGRREIPI